ncbi:MAG TPA: transcriptional regulator [Lachnospiraceae bacterium]|nr:transcriptional regulator [Lachnospiraceae bacterium]
MNKNTSNKQNRFALREHITGADIRQLRKDLSMTQIELASFLRCSKRTVENWESRPYPITGPIVTLFEILLRDPDLVSYYKIPDTSYRLRLHYMHDDMVCSIIDVNELQRKVRVRNYTDNPLLRAFGVNTEPDYSDYEEFLESRCFPKSRDKMKLELKRLGLPFYDPIMIIEKTGGRVEGDRFHIRIEHMTGGE